MYLSLPIPHNMIVKYKLIFSILQSPFITKHLEYAEGLLTNSTVFVTIELIIVVKLFIRRLSRSINPVRPKFLVPYLFVFGVSLLFATTISPKNSPTLNAQGVVLSFYCLGNNNCTPTATPTTQPTIPQAKSPTTPPTPTPTSQPQLTPTPTVFNQPSSPTPSPQQPTPTQLPPQGTGNGNNGLISQILQQLLQLFQQLLNLIQQLLGGNLPNNPAPNPPAPSSTPSVSVTPTSGQTTGTGGMLLGFYGGWGMSSVINRLPDFGVSYVYCDNTYTPFGTYPTYVGIPAVAPNTRCNDWATAASGGYNSIYREVINTFLIPIAKTGGVYLIRVNWEWTGGGCGNGAAGVAPFDCNGNQVIPVAEWSAGTCQLIDTIRSFPELANVPIELDAPYNDAQKPYWPGYGTTPSCKSGPINVTGSDVYFQTAYDGPTSDGSWNKALPQIEAVAAWGRSLGIPLAFGEWCSTYTDVPFSGDAATSMDLISRFTRWMLANNTVAHGYWDDSGLGCAIRDDPNRKAAYTAAYGNTHYSGSFWTSPPFFPFGGKPGSGY
jgi:hypothetical protein